IETRRRHFGHENVLEGTRALSSILAALLDVTAPTAGVLSLAPTKDCGLRSSAVRQLVSPFRALAHVEKLFNLRDHYTGFIFHLDRKDRLILLERPHFLP